MKNSATRQTILKTIGILAVLTLVFFSTTTAIVSAQNVYDPYTGEPLDEFGNPISLDEPLNQSTGDKTTDSGPQQLIPSNCKPELPPNAGGCGLPAFQQFIQNVIDWMNITIVAVAIAMIGYGGFVIMTAGGSAERVSKGKKAITMAIGGIALALASFLIVKAIFYILKVDPNFTPTGIEGKV